MSWFVHETTVRTRWEPPQTAFASDPVLHDRLDEGPDTVRAPLRAAQLRCRRRPLHALSRESAYGYRPSVPASERQDDPAHGVSEGDGDELMGR